MLTDSLTFAQGLFLTGLVIVSIPTTDMHNRVANLLIAGALLICGAYGADSGGLRPLNPG